MTTKEECIVLCANNKDYFFPLEDAVNPVYKEISNRIGRAFRKFVNAKVPEFQKIFWGEWKDELDSLKKIVIFDMGYEIGLEKKILDLNPDLELFFFSWNPIDSQRMKDRVNSFYKKENVFCTCPTDCEKMGLHFCPIPYSSKWTDYILGEDCTKSRKAVWIGLNKGRYPQLKKIYDALDYANVVADIRIVGGTQNEFTVENPIGYYDYCKMISSAEIILDINQTTQSGLTLRVPESIFFGKKLITNNRYIKEYDFYHPNNILIVDTNNLKYDEVKEFIDKPFLPYKNSLKRQFEFEKWLDNFK